MKATLIIEQRGEGYIYDLFSVRGTKRGVRCGITPQAAATEATRILANLCQAEEAFAVVAPEEILRIIPEHLRGDAEPAREALRLKAIEWVADLLVAVYGAREKIPNNVEQFALRNPLTAVAIMMQRREMPTNSPKVAELMEMIDDPDLYSFDRPANMAERAAFELRLYKSPYLNK